MRRHMPKRLQGDDEALHAIHAVGANEDHDLRVEGRKVGIAMKDCQLAAGLRQERDGQTF